MSRGPLFFIVRNGKRKFNTIKESMYCSHQIIFEENSKIIGLSSIFKGGHGSGNFGHSGRPGQVGGSGSNTGIDMPVPSNEFGRSEPTTENEKQFNKILTQMRDMIEGNKSPDSEISKWKYQSGYGMILKEGKWFTPEERPVDVSKMPDKDCFKNATMLVLMDPNKYTYVEGYAETGFGIPMEHAWVVDEKGTVIDPTWKTVGNAYIGIPLTTEFLRSTILKTGMYGLFGWEAWSKFNALKDGFPKDAIAITHGKKKDYDLDLLFNKVDTRVEKTLNPIILTAEQVTDISKEFYHRSNKWEKVLNKIMVDLFDLKKKMVLQSLPSLVSKEQKEQDKEWVDIAAKRFSRFLKEIYSEVGQHTMNQLKQEVEKKKELKGGSGSGNFGHSGRPGQVGGSGSGTWTDMPVSPDVDNKKPSALYVDNQTKVSIIGGTPAEREKLSESLKYISSETIPDNCTIQPSNLVRYYGLCKSTRIYIDKDTIKKMHPLFIAAVIVHEGTHSTQDYRTMKSDKRELDSRIKTSIWASMKLGNPNITSLERIVLKDVLKDQSR